MKIDYKSFSKKEAEDFIKKTLNDNPAPEKLKKLKHLAMSKNIKLGVLQKRFCKKCYSLFNLKNSEIRIKKGLKRIKCKNCGYVTRYKLKDN